MYLLAFISSSFDALGLAASDRSFLQDCARLEEFFQRCSLEIVEGTLGWKLND